MATRQISSTGFRGQPRTGASSVDNFQIPADVRKPMSRAIEAFCRGDYRATVELPLPIRYALTVPGGSHQWLLGRTA